MKAIFMTSGIKKIDEIYTGKTREKLEAELEFLPPVTGAAELPSRPDLKEVEVIFSTWGMLPLTAGEIEEYLPELKAVFYGAGSVQYFARPFIESGVEVFSAWAANAVPVVEYTVAQIILANKGYFQRFHHIPGKAWDNRSFGGYYTGNFGNKVGLIGIGMIGSLVAKTLKAYRLEILAFDPFLPDERAAGLGVTKVSLETLFSECTVISNHLANNPQTVGMLNKKLFDLMKPNAVFINTGRGAQVVEDDLISALEAEPARVALLDVTMPEPPKPDSRFYTLPNVFLSPHIAGSLGDEVARMGDYMAEEFDRWKNGEKTKWGVSLKMLETMA